MQKPKPASETRLLALLVVLRNALLLAVAAAALGAGAGYFGSEATWAGALRGLNWASLVLAAYAGMIAVGSSQVRQVDRNVNLQHPLTAPNLNGEAFPWRGILTAACASLFCAGLWLLLRSISSP